MRLIIKGTDPRYRNWSECLIMLLYLEGQSYYSVLKLDIAKYLVVDLVLGAVLYLLKLIINLLF